jgi:hypothetical protein
LQRAEEKLLALTPAPGRGKRQYDELAPLQAEAILQQHCVAGLLQVTYQRQVSQRQVRKYKDRPARTEEKVRYQLHLSRNQAAIEAQHRTMGWRWAIPFNAGPRLLNRTHSITADVKIPEGGAEGALPSFGGTDGGYSFYVKDGVLQYVQNYVAREYLHVKSNETVPAVRHALRFEFEASGKPDIATGKGAPGRAQLYIDGVLVGQAEFPVTTPLSLGLTGGVTVGADPGAPVAPFYASPFEFTGTVHKVTVDVSGAVIKDDEAEMRRIMARQ